MDNVLLQTAIPIASYCVSSIMMTLVNKFVLAGFQFHMVFLVLGVQVSKDTLNNTFLIMTTKRFCIYISFIGA